MTRIKLSRPELMLIAGTRVVLGVGIGLLLSDKLANPSRRAVGLTMFAIGAITTLPLLMQVAGRSACADYREM